MSGKSKKPDPSLNERSRLLPTSTRSPTVRYDSERSVRSQDSLAPPDVDDILHHRRPWKRYLSYLRLRFGPMGRKGQMVLTCTSIALSSLQANGVYCWPTYGPVVARQMELTGPQAQTIAVGGILGVYLMAAPLGSLTDRYGPRFGSLLSAFLSAAGYLSFAMILRAASADTPFIHIYFTAAFCLVGAATVGSYFSCLTCASLSFPDHPTLSLSVPLSLLGLSSLFLTSFSSIPYFSTPTPSSELIPIRYLIFLGILCPAINLFASIFMRVIPPAPPNILLQISSAHSNGAIADGVDTEDEEEEEADEIEEARMAMSQSLHLDERSPWLLGGFEAALEEVEAIQKGKMTQWTAWGLVKDWEGFWVFGIILALVIGPCETIIASIGSLLTSLLPPESSFSDGRSSPSASASFLTAVMASPPNALKLRNKHVSIISLTSTISRLFAGAMADYLCPPVHAVPLSPGETPTPRSEDNDGNEASIPTLQTHKFIRTRPVRLYRSMFAGICAILLALVLAWCAGILETESGLWVLSAGVGLAYGCLFTLSPAIVSAHYGPSSFGLAWGMVSYFSALGSVLFSYLYALLSEAVAENAKHTLGSSMSTSMSMTIMKKSDSVVMCYGAKCFQGSLWIATAGSVFAGIGFILIGKRWKV